MTTETVNIEDLDWKGKGNTMTTEQEIFERWGNRYPFSGTGYNNLVRLVIHEAYEAGKSNILENSVIYQDTLENQETIEKIRKQTAKAIFDDLHEAFGYDSRFGCTLTSENLRRLQKKYLKEGK